MLPRELRFDLRHSPDFFKSAKVYRSANLLFFYKNSEVKLMRFAVIVKKTHGKAVWRVKTRRKVKSAITSLFKGDIAFLRHSVDVAILVRGKSQDVSKYRNEIIDFVNSLPENMVE